jgi:hypothetical protein
VSAQRAHLRIGEVGVCALGIATVAEAHEFDLGIDPRGDSDFGYMPEEVSFFPG